MELKHAKNYLGTGVKFTSNTFVQPVELTIDNIDVLISENDEAKLICRPLSDLILPCLEGGKIPIVELAEMCASDHNWLITDGECIGMLNGEASYIFGYTKNGFWLTDISMNEDESIEYTSCVLDNQLQLFEWLYEHFFDLHNLIETGQAVNINNLK